MKTTLNKIREYSPCHKGWVKLLRTLGKTAADDEPVSIIQVLNSNGLDDALWCLRSVENHDKEIRLFAVWCARQVQHLMKDQRSLAVLDVTERFANGSAAEQERTAARAAAWAAAGTAARAAEKDAAWAAARAAARAAEKDAAGTAAGTAAWAAARAAAWAAARAAEKDAAWAAEKDAAGTAEKDAAGTAARDAARATQEKELRRVCKLTTEQ